MSENTEIQPFSANDAFFQKIKFQFTLSWYSPFIVYALLFIIGFVAASSRDNPLLNGILLALIIGTIANILLEKVIYTPYRIIQFNNCLKEMNHDMAVLDFQPTQSHQTRKPAPALIAVDRNARKLYVQNYETAYRRLILEPSQIIGAKVERETEMNTTTKHGGRISIFSRIGLGYTFGGKSRSRTTVTEYAFLEIHFELSKDTAPVWVTIPFDTDRRAADSMLVAIEQIRGNL